MNQNLKMALGVIGILAGIALGIYVGVWLCLIGGILGLVSAVSTMVATGTVLYSLIAISLLKIFFAGVAGWVSAFVLILPSFLLFSGQPQYNKRLDKRYK